MSDPGSAVGRRLLLAGLALFGLAALWPPLNHDAGAVLGFAQRMLAGEKLYATLIDVNPPLIFLLSLIPAWAARATGASAPQLLCGFVLLLALASIWLSLRILAQGKLAGYPAARALAAPALLIALLAAPMHSFTQREHLLAIFTLPYLFAAAQRLEGGAAPMGLAIGASAFAALGLLLKPHYVAIAALVEIGCLIARGPARGLRAPEPWVMLGVAALYLAVVLIGFPAYVFEILPLARSLYDHADAGVFLWILIGDQVPALALVLLAGAGVAWRLKDGVLGALALALAGAILASLQGAAGVRGRPHQSLAAVPAPLCAGQARAVADRRDLPAISGAALQRQPLGAALHEPVDAAVTLRRGPTGQCAAGYERVREALVRGCRNQPQPDQAALGDRRRSRQRGRLLDAGVRLPRLFSAPSGFRRAVAELPTDRPHRSPDALPAFSELAPASETRPLPWRGRSVRRPEAGWR